MPLTHSRWPFVTFIMRVFNGGWLLRTLKSKRRVRPPASVDVSKIDNRITNVGLTLGGRGRSYIIVKLDPMLSGNVPLSITFRSVLSNTGIFALTA